MLQNTIFNFLHLHIDKTRPVLLALSGGVDSMCLFHGVAKWKNETGAQVAIVHVDHGWRKESAEEAKIVMQLATDYDIPFYHITLSPENFQKNLELESRDARYRFFSEVAEKLGAQGVLLAHHKDDQVETVFKRVLDGARLSHLSGMRAVSKNENLVLFRPLLQIPKKSLLEYAMEHGISFFSDPTNRDTDFLRARMRETIFPFLREQFGKEFENNMAALSAEAALLRDYFDEKMKPVIKNCIESDLGLYFDLSKEHWHQLEWMECIRAILEKTKCVLSRQQVQEAVTFLMQKSANKWLHAQKRFLYFDRGRLFVLYEKQEVIPYGTKLRMGSQLVGSYAVTVEKVNAVGAVSNHWIDFFKGNCHTYVPLKEYTINKPTGRLYRKNRAHPPRNYFRCLSDKKVPRCFQYMAPLIANNEFVYEDFLLGMPPVIEDSFCLKVSLFRKVAFSR